MPPEVRGLPRAPTDQLAQPAIRRQPVARAAQVALAVGADEILIVVAARPVAAGNQRADIVCLLAVILVLLG